MRLETLSVPSTSDPKRFLPRPLRLQLALSPACPSWVSTGPDLWHRSSPVAACSQAVFNKSDAVQTSLFLLKCTKSIKSLTTLRIRQSNNQHVSSNMQPPHDTSRGYPYQRHHQSSLPSTHPPNYVDHSGQPVGYHSVVQSAQVQRSTYGHPQDHHHPGMHHSYPSQSPLTRTQTAMVGGNPAGLSGLPIAQQSGSSMNPQYPPQHYASDAHHPGVMLNPEVPSHYQNYRPIQHGQPVVPSQPHSQFVTPQKPYPNPAMQTQGGHAPYSNPANNPSSPVGYGSPSPPSSSSSSSPHACGVCGATFTRPHDRKRHYESQHTTIEHVCQYCRKSYARVDSLKRHLDRPCDKMPQSAQKGT
jgi:hypothetical protein